MKFQGAVIKEQGVTFAIICIKRYILDNRGEAQNLINAFTPIFPGIPIVLMSQDNRGVPTYLGRRDIVSFLSKVPLQAIPWKEYTIG